MLRGGWSIQAGGKKVLKKLDEYLRHLDKDADGYGFKSKQTSLLRLHLDFTAYAVAMNRLLKRLTLRLNSCSQPP